MKLDAEQRKVVKRIINIGKRRGESGKDITTALTTGIVESGLRNLKGGDADSEGWRQERRSIYPNPRNVKASVNRFYDELGSAGPGSIGQRAQSAQGSAFPERYGEHVNEARAILKGFNRSHGGSLPKGSSASPGRSQAASARIIALPGTSYAAERKTAALDFIKNRFNPGAVEEFAAQKQSLKDIPGTTLTIPGSKGKKPTSTKQPKLKGPLAQKVARESKGPATGNAIEIGTQVAKKFGLTVTSTTGGTHVAGSYHYQDRAIDISGSSSAMAKAFKYIQKNVPHGKLTELFYDPIGHYWDNGQKVQGAIGEHSDHVHLAI